MLKMNIVLRDDQQKLKNEIYNDWSNGEKNVLAVLPTGGGKSIITSDIILDNHRTTKQVVVAHRDELVAQMSGHIANRNIPHRIIASNDTVRNIIAEHREKFGRSYVSPSAACSVISVDTMIARQEALRHTAKQVGLWIVDEAHHVLNANKWGKAVSLFPHAYGLGVTATPLRADGKGLGIHSDGVFNTLRKGLEMHELIDINALCDFEIVCPKSDLIVDDSTVAESGDWSSHRLKAAAKKSRIIGDVVNTYCRYAYGRKTIVFATDVETANDIAKNFQDYGIKAVAVSGKTKGTVRKKYNADFKSGTIDVLINVDLFDEGYDVPACEVVIMARPTMSLGKYRQMVGRALRYVAGKTALIIDMVSNVTRHGLPDKITQWTLDGAIKSKRKERDPEDVPLRECHVCSKPYERIYNTCPHCGTDTLPPDPSTRSIDTVEGDLILLDRETLEKMRLKTQPESIESMAARVRLKAGDIAAAGIAKKQAEKIQQHTALKDAIAQWAGIQRHQGLTDRAIHKKFYFALGVDVLTALDGSKTRAELEATTNTIKGWCNNAS